MLQVSSPTIPSDGSAVVVFTGRPHARLTWSLSGVGTLTQVDEFSDARGVAKAVFTPGAGNQTAVVEVGYVT